MDDKTAAIPSLKEFKEKQKDRSAQSQRTGSMQTKGQIRKNSQNMKKSSGKPQNPQRRTGASSDTMRMDSKKIRSEMSRGRPSSSNKKPKSAPSSYARERTNSPTASDYDNSRRIDRDAQARRKNDLSSRSQKAKSSGSSSSQRTAPRSSASSQRPSSGRPPQQRASSHHPSGDRGRGQNAANKRTRPPVTKPPVKKKRKPMSRGVRNTIYIIAMLLVVVIVGTVLSLTVLFKTESIEVYGIDRYTKQEIINASGLELGDNIITAPKKQAEDRIERIYPYVEDAQVYSIFPNSIGINLTMAKPACKINAIGGCYIVSNKGKVLEVTSSADEVDVPLIEGIQIKGRAEGEFVDFGSDTLANALYEMFCAFENMQSTRITGINIVIKENIFELRYVYDDRIVVQLGLPEELTYKLSAAHKVIEKLDSEDGTSIAGELDVSTCHETGRSYFNQYSILTPDIAPTESTTAPAEPVEDPSY